MYNPDFKSSEIDFLRYAVNNSEEEMSVWTLEGTIILANELMVKNHHLGDDYADKRTIYNLGVPEFEKHNWDQFIQSLRDNGNTLKIQVKKSFDANTYLYYDVKATLAVIYNREVVWLYGTDITQTVTQEKEIKNLNYVMDAILNNIPVYLFVKDSSNDFRYIYWNKAFEFFSKIPAQKVIGNTDFEVFPNMADAEKFRQDDLAVLESGAPLEIDEEYIDSNGVARYCHTLKSLIYNDHALPWIIGISWDITDMKNVENELLASRIKAEESDKLKSAFLANMSHELRTPLNAIVGFSRLICNDAEDPDYKQYYDIIEDNANMLMQLINDILDISKIEAGILEFVDNNVDLHEMLMDTYEVHRHRTSEGVTLVYEESPDKITIKCDRNRLIQVITNFINNAIKFTSHGEIRYGFKREADNIIFFVTDTGMGIAPKQIDNVFNRFTKLNNSIQGTGLGLSICQTIAQKMKGRLWVESQERVGSTFYFSIPYNECNGEVVEEYISEPKPVIRTASEAKKTILIGEEVDSNYLLANTLLSLEYDIIRGVDGDDLLAKYKEYKPDLILTELKLSNRDAFSVMREIRASSDVPIIALTSSVYESDRKAAFDSGCNDFVTKPVSVDTLLRVLKKYI